MDFTPAVLAPAVVLLQRLENLHLLKRHAHGKRLVCLLAVLEENCAGRQVPSPTQSSTFFTYPALVGPTS